METRKAVIFPRSLMTPWVTGKVVVTNTDIRITTANTVLGFFPMGKYEQTMPLRNISNVGISTKYDLEKIALGVLQLILAFILRFFFGGLLADIAVFVLVVYGVKHIFDGIITTLQIQRSGDNFFLDAPYTCKADFIKLSEEIKKALEYEAQKTNLFYHGDKMAKSFADELAKRFSNYANVETQNEPENPPQKEDTDEKNSGKEKTGYIRMLSLPVCTVLVIYCMMDISFNVVTSFLEKKVIEQRETYLGDVADIDTVETELQQNQTETDLELEDYERSYFAILQEYQDIAQNKIEAQTASYVNSAYADSLSFTNSNVKQNNIYVSLIDINEDDVPELFIALKEINDSNEETYRIIDIYTYCNAHEKRVFDDDQLGFRDQYAVCANGMIRCLIKDTEHPLSHVPLEAVYYILDSAENITETERMGSDNAEFETFMNKYQLYKVNNWNDLSVWENPLEK